MEKENKGFVTKQGVDMPLGVSLQNNMFNFAVAMPGSSSCNLVLYKKGETDPAEVIPMEASALGVFTVAVQIPKKAGYTEYEYLYQTGETYICDPYAVKINGREVYGEDPKLAVRAEVYASVEEVTPYKRHALSDLVLYKLHVRGFTMGNGSGVRKKGTYAGLTEKIPYLKNLGINAVLLLPVVEYDELEASHKNARGPVIGEPARTYLGQTVAKGGKKAKKASKEAEDEKKAAAKVNYWGYGAASYYFAPKTAYASNKEKACAEFKQMVDKLHAAGIDVYLEMMFDGSVSQSFMLECLRHWVRTYGIDGFHISEQQLPVSLVAGDVYLKNAAFFISDVPDWLKNQYPNRLLEYRESFCMEMRRFLKGDEGMVPAVTYYMKNRREEAARVHFIADHNGFSLADLYSYDVRHNEANGENGRDGSEYNFSWNCGEEGPTKSKKIQALRMRMMKNALALTLLSQGTPMLLAGDEFGRTKLGNNNAYCQDNEISWLDWNLAKKNKGLLDFVKLILDIRKEHPLFTMERTLRENDFIGCGWPEISVHGTAPWKVDYSAYNRLAAYLYCGSYVRRADRTFEDNFYMMFNMHWEKHEFELPEMEGVTWEIVFDTAAGKNLKKDEVFNGKTLELDARSVVLLKSVPNVKEKKKTVKKA